MSYGDDPMDREPPLPRPADEWDEIAAPDPMADPAFVAGGSFWYALRQEDVDLELLWSLTTPESHLSWGDFGGPRQFVSDLAARDVGLSQSATRSAEDPTVAFVTILPGVSVNTVMTAEQVFAAAAAVIVVKCQDGRWLADEITGPVVPEFRRRG